MPTPNETPANGQDAMQEFDKLMANYEEAHRILRHDLNMENSLTKEDAAEALRAHVRKMSEDRNRAIKALEDIAEMTDADNKDSYRADDPEGCLDATHRIATNAARRTTP